MKNKSESHACGYPWSRIALFGALALIGGGLDLWTKHAVFAWRGLPGELPPWWVWPEYVGVETAVNIGALFGMGAGMGWFFAAISVVAAFGIVIWLFRFQGAQSLWLTIAMGCVMAGIIGNLYDRLGLWWEPTMDPTWRSGVRDWILLRYQRWTWPNFNIADSLLVCGAIMIFCYSLRAPALAASHQHAS
jgi:signal peptidase II